MTLDLTSLRAVTPGVRTRIHLNNAGAGLLSRGTFTTMVDHLTLEAEIGGYEAASARKDEIESVHGKIAQLINGRADEVALFDNSTHAFNAAFHAIPFQEGDRIITARSDYGSSVLTYLQLARRRGVVIDVIDDDESGQLDVAALRDAITERTRLISICHVPTGGGLVNPVDEVGRIARDAGVLFLLDATQSIGQFPVDVRSIGADFVTSTGRKFLRGPRGTGFLWARTDVLARVEPSVNEIAASTWDGANGFRWHTGARRFETWERSYSNILGLGNAVSEAIEVGMEEIGRRAVHLGAVLREGLEGIDRVRTHDLGVEKCAIVTARIDGLDSNRAADELRARSVNVSTTTPEHAQLDARGEQVHPLIRFSPHYYNTEDELHRALDAVADIVAAG